MARTYREVAIEQTNKLTERSRKHFSDANKIKRLLIESGRELCL
jgi:hypothetical protein